MKTKLFILLLLGVFIHGNSNAQLIRFKDIIFADVKISNNVKYGSSIPFASNDPIDLVMDIYEPVNDTMKKRPVLVFIHSGSFLNANLQGGKQPAGVKEDNWVIEACKHYAKRGYVTVALTHRVGWNPTLTTLEARSKSIFEAVWRARADLKAGIRFFKKDAATVDMYRINPDKIAVGGSSSGGYVAVHGAMLDKPEELVLPKFLDSEGKSFIDTLKLGGFEGNSGNEGYSSKYHAIMNFGGAVGDTSIQEAGDPPIIAAHGVNDKTTPYKTAIVVTATGSIPIIEVSGSYDLVRKSQLLGNQKILMDAGFNDSPFAGLKPYENEGFEFYNWWNSSKQEEIDAAKSKMNDMFDFVTPRLFAALSLPTMKYDKIVVSRDSNKYNTISISITVDTEEHLIVNLNNPEIIIHEITILDITGKRISNFKNNIVETKDLVSGMYILNISTSDGVISHKFIK